MAYAEITYASHILSLQQTLHSLDDQLEAEEALIRDSKQGVSLLTALLSAGVRSNTLYQVSQAKSRVAQLKSQRTQADTELLELTRLCVQYPDHDRMIKEEQQVRFRSWVVAIQEDDLDVCERELLLAERLEEKRQREEEQRIQEELAAIEQQQKELERKKAELLKGPVPLKRSGSGPRSGHSLGSCSK